MVGPNERQKAAQPGPGAYNNMHSDFKGSKSAMPGAPAGMPLASLQQLIAGGMASASFRVTFSEARLGLELQDVEEGQPGAVQVIGFPRADDGTRGPAELSGKIHLGDCVSRVNDTSCLGLDYRAVLDLIIGAARPVTLVFERPASGS